MYGFKISKSIHLDVKKFCSANQLQYVCAGDFEGEQGVVIGLLVPMENVIQDNVLGCGKIHPFSIENFLEAYHQIRNNFSAEKLREIKSQLFVDSDEEIIPELWSISYTE